MALAIPRAVVEQILLGPIGDRRQLQDSPILGDVWVAFAERPKERQDLLITPVKTTPANLVAQRISDRLDRMPKPAAAKPATAEPAAVERATAEPAASKPTTEDPNIAYLQGIVAARLTFGEVLRVVVPLTEWWHSSRSQERLKYYLDPDHGPGRLKATITKVLELADPKYNKPDFLSLSAFCRYVGLTGLILWANDAAPAKDESRPDRTPDQEFRESLAKVDADPIATLLGNILKDIEFLDDARPKRQRTGSRPPYASQARSLEDDGKLVYQISRNRKPQAALIKSIPAVKADAARGLFKVDCSKIAWAVLDSGIYGDHPALKDKNGKSRVVDSFDFSKCRLAVSLSNTKESTRKRNVEELLENRFRALNGRKDRDRIEKSWRARTDRILLKLGEDARDGRPTDWRLVRSLVEADASKEHINQHGTHVAGIIAANAEAAAAQAKAKGQLNSAELADGMCPDINLYDFRVLGSTADDTEFAVIAALQ